MGAAASVARRNPRCITLPRRFYKTWSDPSQGPPPVLQLSYHNEYDRMREQWASPDLYFRTRSLVYSIPEEKLLEKGDGDAYLLSSISKRFLRSADLLVQGNNKRNYSIGPSFSDGNLEIWFGNGSCALKVAKWFYIGEVVDGEKVTTVTAYAALAQYFINLLEKFEGPDIMKKLSPIVMDLFQKMAGNTIDPKLMKHIEDIILNHPAMMSTDACIYVIQEAERVIKKELLCSGIASDRALANKFLSYQAHLWSDNIAAEASGPRLKGEWVDIAMKHFALRHWYEFSLKQRGRSEMMLGKARAIRIKKGMHYDQVVADLRFSGGGLVSLWRNGLAHYAEAELKEKFLEALQRRDKQSTPNQIRDKFATAWPIKKKVIIATLIINFPMYLPIQIENFARAKMLKSLGLHNCWPRHPRSYGYIPLYVAGFNAVLLKLGLQSAYQGTGASVGSKPSSDEPDDDDTDNELEDYNADTLDKMGRAASVVSKPSSNEPDDDDMNDDVADDIAGSIDKMVASLIVRSNLWNLATDDAHMYNGTKRDNMLNGCDEYSCIVNTSDHMGGMKRGMEQVLSGIGKLSRRWGLLIKHDWKDKISGCIEDLETTEARPHSIDNTISSPSSGPSLGNLSLLDRGAAPQQSVALEQGMAASVGSKPSSNEPDDDDMNNDVADDIAGSIDKMGSSAPMGRFEASGKGLDGNNFADDKGKKTGDGYL